MFKYFDVSFLQKIIYRILAFLSGVFVSEVLFDLLLGDEVFLGRWVWWLSMGFVVVAWFLKRLFVLSLLCVFVSGIFYFHGSFLSVGDESGIKYYVGQSVEWTVRIDAEVDVRRSGQKLIVEVLSDDVLRGRVLLNVPKYPRYNYGDVIEIIGLLEEPFETEEFSYKKYLERYQVYGVVKNPRVRVIDNAMHNPFYDVIFRIKREVQDRINKLWAEPYASFESGLLLGARKGIPDYLTEAFNVTGLTHIIAISGYNISLVIMLVGVLFNNFSRKKRVVMSFIFVVIFTVLVGMSAAVVRAAIMGSIGLFSIYFGRSTQVTLTLLMSALLMNIYNPKILPYDVGFQLSFAATCGIVYVSPRIEKWFLWVTPRLEMREALQMTIAAQISTLPIILFHFGRLSIVSPLANMLTAPFIPLSMGFGAIAVLMSYLSEICAQIFIGITWLFLEIIILLTLFCAQIPYASVEILSFDFEMLVICYVILFIWLGSSQEY